MNDAGADAEAQVRLAYRLAASREPSEPELSAANAFLETQPLREFALAVFNTNAFLYVN